MDKPATKYEPVIRKGAKKYALICKDASRTQQNMANDCDVNTIMKRFMKTGNLPVTNHQQGFYGDVSAVPDYTGSMEIVMKAHDAFMSLPSDVRKRFANDPANMIDFLQDKNNLDEAVRLGLVKKPEGKPPGPEPGGKPKAPKGSPPEDPPKKDD